MSATPAFGSQKREEVKKVTWKELNPQYAKGKGREPVDKDHMSKISSQNYKSRQCFWAGQRRAVSERLTREGRSGEKGKKIGHATCFGARTLGIAKQQQ